MTTESRSGSVKAGSLLLDSKNTRIPSERRSGAQRQLLHELLEHEDVAILASSIAKRGLFPNERLVVVANGGRYTVLEGNRRLAAIKLLLNPELAPTEKQVRYFRRLSMNANLTALGKIDVAIIQSRIAAAPIIAALHTKEAKKRWSSLQQARFYRELVEEGQTPAEVAEEVGVALGEVRSYLRTELLHRIALTLEYDSHVRRKIEDSKYPLTTLERFIESKVGRKFLGIEFDDDKGFRGIVHPDRFKAVLARVEEDIATTPGMTRQINDEKGFNSYITRAEEKILETKVRGKFDAESLLGGDDVKLVGIGEIVGSTPAKTRTQKPSTSIVPRGFTCATPDARVHAVFKELRSLKIVDHRNSTGVMLRVLLDIALWGFIKRKNLEKAVCNHFDETKRKRLNNSDWTPPLRDLISYAVENRIFPGMTASGYKAVRTLAAKDAGYFITIEGFNAFTHNPYVTPTEGDLRALWLRAEPMLEIILRW